MPHKIHYPKGYREARNLERAKSAVRSLGAFLILFGVLGLILLHVAL